MKSPIILRIFKGNQLVEVKQFEADQVIIGHNAEVTIDLDDDSVSAIHCLIERRDAGYYLCDMGSATGTFKNGNPILDEPISSGENFEVGPFRLQFFMGAPKPQAKPTMPPPNSVGNSSVGASQHSDNIQIPPSSVDERTQIIPASIPAAPKESSMNPARAELPKGQPAGLAGSIPQNSHQQPKPKLPEVTQTSSNEGPAKNKNSAHQESKSKNLSHAHNKKTGGTFAPPSEFDDLKKYLKPTKGPVVEVIVAWQERVLETYHFGGNTDVNIGSSDRCQVKVPASFIRGALPLLDLKGGCRVLAPVDVGISVVNGNEEDHPIDYLVSTGKAQRSGASYSIRMDQGEIICLSFASGALQVFIRYVPNTIKPPLAMPLDFTGGELTGLIVALVLVSLTALYMSVYTPEPVAKKEEEIVKIAKFVYNKPTNTTLPKPTTTTTTMPVVVKPPPTTTLPPQPPVKIKVAEQKKEVVKQGNKESVSATKQLERAKAAEVRPMPSKVDRPKKFTSIKQGGATKVGETEGANAQSAKDVNKVGLLAAFGGGGVRKNLDQAYSGSGDLLGMANQATGKAGQNQNREGDDIGSKFKDTGAGGKGTATQGIAGVGTKGRGSGMSEYGGGVGLGGKGNVTIEAAGDDAGWSGTIDREAVRRVIRSILPQIKSCYERELRVKKGLEGKVVIRFVIMEQGRVKSAGTKSSSMGNSTVESCVAARIREARFPEPPVGSEAEVDYPFVFGNQE